MGRGFLSLALHLDPILRSEHQWLKTLLAAEPMQYWKGNVFVGHDKTYLESIFGEVQYDSKRELRSHLVFAWRDLQLSGLSCCGIDNVAVVFSHAMLHVYLIPFLHLIPDVIRHLKPENHNLYTSFRNWWEETGRRPMPEPAATHRGGGKFEWDTMKVAMKPSRVPVGWAEVIEAVLLHRIKEFELARLCATRAVGKNTELRSTLAELIPAAFGTLPVVRAPTPSMQQRQYIIVYNPSVGLGNLAVVMVSAHILAKLTGRHLLLHWNVNSQSQHAYKLLDTEGVTLIHQYAQTEEVIFSRSMKHVYFFHMMDSAKLGETLELLGCSDLARAFRNHPIVSVTSNMYFAPLLAQNPHTPPGGVPDLPELLSNLLAPSDNAAQRALAFARTKQWGQVPIVAIHVRAREQGEDNDDWPTADSPTRSMLDDLLRCTERAVARDLGGAAQWDVFVASTTEKGRSAVVDTLQGHARGLRRVLTLPDLDRQRRFRKGVEDAMAEALLISRADIFVRLVIGTSGFSTFAYLSNALRSQNAWAASMPSLERSGYAPNFVVTSDCGAGRCHTAPPEARMASIAWHGKQFTTRSCGDPVERVEREGTGTLGCRGLVDVETNKKAEEL